MTPKQILVILRARFWLVLAVAAVLTLTVGVLSLVLPKRYVAAVSLVVDIKSADPLTGALLPIQLLPGYLATQLDIISSHSVALKVVDHLRLTELADIQEQFRMETGGYASIRDWLADRLLQQLDVRPSRDSSVINVAYSSGDPQVAAEMANAFADAYIATNLELKTDPARRQAGWFEDQVAELRKALESAQQRLSEYQSEQEIVASSSERVDLENARLAELSSQLIAAQGAMFAAQSRQRQVDEALARGSLTEIPDVLGNPLVQSLKAELVRAEAKLADVGSRFGNNHPQYQSAVAERDSLRDKLEGELAAVRGTIDQAAAIASQQVATLQDAVDEQKSRVLALNQERDTLSVLTRDVESARAAYDAAMQRRTQVRLESEVNQTDVVVLNRAVPPLNPAFPLFTLNVMLAGVLGTLLGAGAALLIEGTNRRVRLASDLADLAGVPVLAVLKRPTRRDRRRRRLALTAAATPT